MSLKDKDLKQMLQKKKANLAWTALHLGREEWEYINTLPESLNFHCEGFDINVVHGSPISDKDYINPSITKKALLLKLNHQRFHLFVCGHSHIPFSKVFGDLRVVNCGAVGLSINGDPRPSYALVDISESRNISCRTVRFDYSYEKTIEDIESRNVPGIDRDVYLRGINAKQSEGKW